MSPEPLKKRIFLKPDIQTHNKKILINSSSIQSSSLDFAKPSVILNLAASNIQYLG